ncbi:MAG TPA: HAMP domain-containing sensor histidine kinase [Nocardioides sp.]|nr:HAMP domain-containing sensor histidine kinase [Nocardioides sp.]
MRIVGSRALTDLGGFRRRLVLLAGVGAAAVAAALGLVAQLILATTTNRTVERVIEDRSDAVIALIDAATPGTRLTVPSRGVDPGVVVYDASGHPVAGSEPPSLRSDFVALAHSAHETGVTTDLYALHAEPFTTRSGARGTVVVVEPLAPYEHQEAQALEVSIASGVLIVLLTVAVASWISHRALSPVADMARTAEEWSEHDLERRFDLGPPTDEIRALAHTLDGLLDKVGQAIRTEHRLTAELAHELRTPLTAIQGTAELVGMRPDLDPELRADLAEIGRATRGMAATITVLLELARRAPDERVATGTCPVVDLLAEAVRLHPRIEVRYDGGAVLRVPADVALRALAPTLDNAVRLARDVAIDVELTREHVDLVVGDDGPGVADPDVLFHPGAVPGRSGLGLALARRIARSAGGDVFFAGNGQTRGATFVVRLPRA